MALREAGQGFARSLRPRCQACRVAFVASTHRSASNAAAAAVRNEFSAAEDIAELEQSSSLLPSMAASDSGTFDPVAQAKQRTDKLPPSRYQFRPPKYYRGPLHPYQPPPSSDPVSREFVPGPFTLPRLEQTYHSTVAADVMTLSYTHFPHGYTAPPASPRLRSWDGSSPYHKNRPLRPPRGADSLRPVRRPITFRNVPRLDGVTVHAFVKNALTDSGALAVAGMAIQAITGARCSVHSAKTGIQQWGLRKGTNVSVTSELRGEDAYHFLSKCVDVVMPRIRDYKGVKGTSGDGTGNIAFGLKPDEVANFPEIEVNYDAYPPKFIPGCHVIVKTTATNDRDARMLLMALGVPFYGKLAH